MRDLFEPNAKEALPAVLAAVDVADPWGAIWARMCKPGGGFGRSGCSGDQSVVGFGIEGRGPTAEDAARQWVAGARSAIAEGEHRGDR